jgi:PepSY-associated TM region
MASAAVVAKKYAILIHRWMGVLFCLLFIMWFVSGIVMMYASYPEVSTAERLERAGPLGATAIRMSPAEVAVKAELDTGIGLSSVTLLLRGRRPVYRFSYGFEQVDAYADTGELAEPVSVTEGAQLASKWVGTRGGTAHYEGLLRISDEWTLLPAVGAMKPWRKYSFDAGDEVYISESNGAVAQHTTRSSRLAAYFGAIPHWIYIAPLRRNGKLWNRVVVWSSGIGTVMSLLGIVVGLWLYSPSKRYRFPDGARSVPYAGQKRWHTILGLLFGLFACTWAFSGMMSMSPFDLRTTGPGQKLSAALRGKFSIGSYSLAGIQKALSAGPSVKELELSQFADAPHYVARFDGARSLVVPVSGAPFQLFPERSLSDALARAAAPLRIREVRRVEEYEAYYVSRHGEAPLPVLFVQLDNPEGSMYYVDLHTARMISAYSTESRWNRWLYHGLHSLDIPVLYKYRPLWDIVVLTLMLGGTALCVTSVVIGWRRIKRKALQWTH